LFICTFLYGGAINAQVNLENTYSVKVSVQIQTNVPAVSDKDPAPVYLENKQISGTVIGKVIKRNIGNFDEDKDAWKKMTEKGNVTVFTAHSNFRLRDENDYSKIAWENKYPVTVNIEKVEMDYVGTAENLKYTKTVDFKAGGVNDAEAISLTIQPFNPTLTETPATSHYVVMLAISRYMDKMSITPEGKGQSLKWDDSKQELVPDNSPLDISVMGTLTEKDPPAGWKAVITDAKEFNDYFLGDSSENLILNLEGFSFEPGNSNRTRKITVRLEFTKVPDISAMPENTGVSQ
jgi:hypothetical protein